MFGGLAGRLIGNGIGHLLDLDDDDRKTLARTLGFIGMVATFDITECALQVADAADVVTGMADAASITDIDLPDFDASDTHSGTSDVHFGSSSSPICWWCKGTGESTWPSSGTVVPCPHCGGSGH
jgi:hypothetical protein